MGYLLMNLISFTVAIANNFKVHLYGKNGYYLAFSLKLV